MALVFQYGSNTCIRRLNSAERLAGAARLLGAACTVAEYELDFTVWSRQNGCAAADLSAAAGRPIWGVLYDVPDGLIRRSTAGDRVSMDAVEREGVNYRRRTIRVRLPDGRRIGDRVLTYVVRRPEAGLRTAERYVAHILRGLRASPVPEDYIGYVKRRVVANNPLLRGAIAAL